MIFTYVATGITMGHDDPKKLLINKTMKSSP